MSDSGSVDLALLYRETRERLTNLVRDLDAAALAVEVPTCPGWAVRDVVAHVVGIADDAVAGRIDGIPSDEYNARQVARLADVGVPDLLGLWAQVAPPFEEVIAAFDIWSAVIDVASHEQDIRGAIGMPGARDCDAVRHCVANMLSRLWLPARVRVITEDGEFLAGPDCPKHPYVRDGEGRRSQPADPDPGQASHDPSADGARVPGPLSAGTPDSGSPVELKLSTSTFEAFRWRMGRRSLAQLTGLCWSGDPAVVLDHLCFFGPSASDIIE